MNDSHWTASEKKIARRVFEGAVQSELAQLISEFKAKAAVTEDSQTLWEIRDWLNKRQREIDSEYDYRYSQLVFVFARLVRSGRIRMEELAGLSEQKLAEIQFVSER